MTSPVALVLLEDAVLPEREALVETLRQRHPGLRWTSSADAADADANGPILIQAGDHLMVAALMPAPVPYDQELWQRASWIWPEAFHAVAQHRAHLIVSTMGSAENKGEIASLSAIESARLTTAVVGGLLNTFSGCLGVLWDGKVGRSAEMWLKQSRSSFDPFPDHPFALWIDVVPFISGKTIGAYTVGLSAFTGREVEFEVDGLDEPGVTSRVARLASFLIGNGLDAATTNGTVIEGDPETGPVAVIYRNSRFTRVPVVSFFPLQDRFGRLRTYEIIPSSIARHHPLLIMLGKVGLFDPVKAENQIKLRPDHYISEIRLESYDRGVSGALSSILATDTYAEADAKARRALASGDIELARSLLLPFANEVGQFQEAAKLGLTLRDLFMFAPAPPRSP